ncbi:hypothetical protein FRC09_016821, partial [Ceratobasidium sp. 395]
MLKTGSDLKAHMDWLRSTANSMRSEDIKIGYEYETLNGYSAELTDDGLSAIAASPDVKSINQDTRIMLKTDSDLKAHIDWLKSRASSMRSEDIKIRSEFNALNGYAAELTDDGISAIAA